MAGYIKLYRKFTDWEWYQDANATRVFLHLLLSANYEDKRWCGKLIKRGQLVTSLERLSDCLKLTIQQIRTALEKLESTGEINKQTTNQYSLITVCKFDCYQLTENTECQTDNKQITNECQTNNKQITNECQTDDKQITNECQTNNKQITTTKEYKESKEVDNYSLSVLRACVREDFEQMKNEGGLIESIAMLNHTTPEVVLQKIDEFYAHCTAGCKEFTSKGDLRSHFRNWARIRIAEENQQKKMNYGRNKESVDKRGGFEPADNTDYSA